MTHSQRLFALEAGNVDFHSFCSYEFLDVLVQKIGSGKGLRHLLDATTSPILLQAISQLDPSVHLGGGIFNVLRTFAKLGGRAAYAGARGDDGLGDIMEKELQNSSVSTSFKVVPGMSGFCCVLVTPDADRTMFTHLGSVLDHHLEDLPLIKVQKSDWLFLTAYHFDFANQRALVCSVLDALRGSAVKIAFDVADPLCVKRWRPEIRRFIESHCDLVFANEEEARALWGAPIDAVVRDLARHHRFTTVVKLGAQGAVAAGGNEICRVPGIPVQAVDTTCAGDAFAGAFLYAVSQGEKLNESLAWANAVGAYVVTKRGLNLDCF